MNASNKAKGVKYYHSGNTRVLRENSLSLPPLCFSFSTSIPLHPPTKYAGKMVAKRKALEASFLIMFLGRVNQLHDLCTWYFPIRNQLCVNFKVYSSTRVWNRRWKSTERSIQSGRNYLTYIMTPSLHFVDVDQRCFIWIIRVNNKYALHQYIRSYIFSIKSVVLCK